MSNGHTALRVLAPEPAPVAADKPAPEIDIRLGEAVALGAFFISTAADGYRQTGVLAASDQAASADRIAAVALLQLDHEFGDEDFRKSARESGRQVLRQYVTSGCPPQRADAVIDLWIDELLGIVGRLVREERIIRAAWVN